MRDLPEDKGCHLSAGDVEEIICAHFKEKLGREVYVNVDYEYPYYADEGERTFNGYDVTFG